MTHHHPKRQTQADAESVAQRPAGQHQPGGLAWVNGEYVALEHARVSVLDRGLLFADSVYEVIPVYGGRAFRLAAHLRRLQASLDGLFIPNPYSPAQWQTHIESLIAANAGGDMAVYLQVTRGAPPRRAHGLPADPEPNVIAFCQTLATPDARLWQDGVAAVTAQDTRWRYCAIKSTSLLANVMAADYAHRAGAEETILIRDGAVLEGSSSNVFAVVDDRLVTPALRETILPGITRAVILELAEYNGVAYAELDLLPPEALRAASEIWISSSTREIVPVTRLDGVAVGAGRPGPLGRRMRTWLQAQTQ